MSTLCTGMFVMEKTCVYRSIMLNYEASPRFQVSYYVHKVVLCVCVCVDATALTFCASGLLYTSILLSLSLILPRLSPPSSNGSPHLLCLATTVQYIRNANTGYVAAGALYSTYSVCMYVCLERTGAVPPGYCYLTDKALSLLLLLLLLLLLS